MSRPVARSAALVAWGPAALALLAWLLTAQHAVPPGRWVGGALLVFVLPGAAATLALFSGRTLSTVERTVLAPALSLAVVVLGGLLVNVVGARLTAGTWAGLLATATVLLAGVGYVRQVSGSRDGRAASVESAPSEEAGRFTPAGRGTLALKLGSLALVAVLLGGAFWIAMRSALNDNQAGYSSLSIVNEDDHDPTDGLRPVTVAVNCEEDAATHYVVTVRGAQAGILTQFTISLYHGEVWKRDILVPEADKITVNLFKGTDSTPYRTVFLSGPQ